MSSALIGTAHSAAWTAAVRTRRPTRFICCWWRAALHSVARALVLMKHAGSSVRLTTSSTKHMACAAPPRSQPRGPVERGAEQVALPLTPHTLTLTL